MSAITNLEPGFYRVPLPTVLTDSTHGEMRAFELCTVRVRDADGAEGIGYTFTVGRNGGAVHDTLGAQHDRDVGFCLGGGDLGPGALEEGRVDERNGLSEAPIAGDEALRKADDVGLRS